ncbi:MAG: ribonuclease HII [Candidatus Woesearchaeota archaeon]
MLKLIILINFFFYMLISGIDEAGRGPVIGPLVLAGISLNEKDENKLIEINVKDSKLLTKKDREILFKKILSVVKDYKIITLTPEIIDAHLKSEASNLNILEAKTTAEIINFLNPDKVIIDLPDKNQKRYQSYIIEKLNEPIKEKIKQKSFILITEHKADFNYPVVSAASILAKVTRDKYIENLKEIFKQDFGSGYPSDPKTIDFIKKNWNNDKIHFIRKEWLTFKEIKKNKTIEKEQKKLFDY